MILRAGIFLFQLFFSIPDSKQSKRGAGFSTSKKFDKKSYFRTL